MGKWLAFAAGRSPLKVMGNISVRVFPTPIAQLPTPLIVHWLLLIVLEPGSANTAA